MIDLIIQTWWLWFLIGGVIVFAFGFALTTRLLFAGKWASWLFIFLMALAGCGLLTMLSGAAYAYIQPTEKLLVDIPDPPPPPPGELAFISTVEFLESIINVWVILFIKSPFSLFFVVLLGVFILKTLTIELIELVRRKTR